MSFLSINTRLCFLFALMLSTTALSNPTPEFLKLFEHEINNRSYALAVTERAADKLEDPQQAAFWQAYYQLEQYNQKLYKPLANKYAIKMKSDWLVSLKTTTTWIFMRLMPATAKNKLASATQVYMTKLEQLERLADKQDNDFFRYVVEQEQAQVEALSLLASDEPVAATATLNHFISNNHYLKSAPQR